MKFHTKVFWNSIKFSEALWSFIEKFDVWLWRSMEKYEKISKFFKCESRYPAVNLTVKSYGEISRRKFPQWVEVFFVAKSSHLIVLLSRSVCVYGELGLACLDWRDLFARKFISTTSVYLFRSSDVRTSKCVEACKRFVSSCLFWLLARTCDLTVKVRHSKTFQLFATSISLPLFHPSSHRNSPFICKNHSRFLNW